MEMAKYTEGALVNRRHMQVGSLLATRLPKELLLNIGDCSILEVRDIANLLSSCRDFNEVFSSCLAKRVREAAKSRPGLLHWACVKGYDRIVKMLLAGPPLVRFGPSNHHGNVHPSKVHIEQIPLCNPNMGLFNYKDFSSWNGFLRRVSHHTHRDLLDLPITLDQWLEDQNPHQTGPDGYNLSSFTQWVVATPPNVIGQGALVHPRHFGVEKTFGAKNILLKEDQLGQLYFPIHHAAEGGHLDLVEFLVKIGTSVDMPCRRDEMRNGYRYRQRPEGSGRWQAPEIQTLHPFDGKDPYEEAEMVPQNPMWHFMVTSLYLAIVGGHHDVVSFLLSLNPSERGRCLVSDANLSPLHAAASSLKAGPEMIELLLKHHKYDIHELNFAGLPVIWIAYLNGNWDIIPCLISNGALLDHDIGHGYTPLIHAIMFAKFSAAEKLIKAGANVNVMFRSMTSRHMTPLFWDMRGRTHKGARDAIRRTLACNLKGLRPADMLCCLWVLQRGNLRRTAAYWDTGDILPQKPYVDLITLMVKKASADITSINPLSGRSTIANLFEFNDTLYRRESVACYEQANWEYNSHITPCTVPVCPFLEALLALGAKTMSVDKHNNSLIELAIQLLDWEACEFLMNRSEDAVARFASHWTLDRYIAVWLDNSDINHLGGCLEGLKLFLKFGLATRSDLVQHPRLLELIFASCCHGFDSDNADIEYQDEDYEAEDHSAPDLYHRHCGHQELADFLLKELDFSDDLLHLSVPGKLEGTLLDLLSDPDFGDSINLSVVKFLLEKGADPNRLDRHGRSLASRLIQIMQFYSSADTELLRFAAEKGMAFHRDMPTTPSGAETGQTVPRCRPDHHDIWRPRYIPSSDEAGDDTTQMPLPFEEIIPCGEFWLLAEGNNVDSSAELEADTSELASTPVEHHDNTNAHPGVNTEIAQVLTTHEPDLGDINGMVAAIRHCPPGHDNFSMHENCLKHVFPIDSTVPDTLKAIYLREACSSPDFQLLECLLDTWKVDVNVLAQDGRSTLAWVLGALAEDSHLDRQEFEASQTMFWNRIYSCIKVLADHGAYMYACAPGSLCPMDYVRGLVDWNSPPHLRDLWGARRFEIVSFFHGSALLGVLPQEDTVIFYDQPFMSLTRCRWFVDIPRNGGDQWRHGRGPAGVSTLFARLDDKGKFAADGEGHMVGPMERMLDIYGR